MNFNPRSREGSDDGFKDFFIFAFNFNPRSREGSDDLDKIVEQLEEISIHAPARGATAKTHKQLI